MPRARYRFNIHDVNCTTLWTSKMIMLNCLLLVVLLSCMGSMAKDGHCIWYGECGQNSRGKVTNCYYNGTAPRLTDQTALKTMESMCGMFYNGSNTATCCAPDQIRTLSGQMRMFDIMVGHCPSCYYNFRSLFCAMTCHPQQSRFITVREFGSSVEHPGVQTVEAIIYSLADDFAQRLLDACREVLYPGGNQHSLDTLCGCPYDQCTKEVLMNYLGIENPAAPFPFYVNLAHITVENNYYNQSTFLCNEAVQTLYENKTACDYFNCPKSPIPSPPDDVPDKYSNVSYRTTQLIIVPDNQNFAKHYYMSPPAPRSEYLIGPVLELGFLTRVLDLQANIFNIEAYFSTDNRSIRLTDICLRPMKPDNNNCAIFSVLQYFQNSHENLHKSIGDEFFTYFDYITHVVQCSETSTFTHDEPLGLSCLADFGSTMNPALVFANYPTTAYTNATALVITIAIENSNETEKFQSAKVWERVFLEYMRNFTDTQASLRAAGRWGETANFTVYYSTQRPLEDELNHMLR